MSCIAALFLGLSLLAFSSLSAQSLNQATAIPPKATMNPVNDDGFDRNGKQISERPKRPLLQVAKSIGKDQGEFWNIRTHLQHANLKWIYTSAGMSALVASDGWISRQVPSNYLRRSKEVSNASVYALIGLSGSGLLWGRMTGNDHLAEAGMLGGEAAINSTMVAYAFKGAIERPRPSLGLQPGTSAFRGASFPSEHAAIAWSVASVWAHEYPGWFSKTMAYGLASAVTITRVTSREHFASDAVVGSAIGWYFGREVYTKHHDRDLGGSAWGGLFELGEGSSNHRNEASSYLPSDSWVYSAFDRLIASGFISSAYLGIRPWTRTECMRLVEEAQERLRVDESAIDSDAGKILAVLADEFGEDSEQADHARSLGLNLDSIYFRGSVISGPVLRDGYHFGQTIVNDYGRPYGEGLNSIAGFTTHAQIGPLALFLRSEIQHSPEAAPDSQQVMAAIAAVDGTLPMSDGKPGTHRLRLVEGTLGLAIRGVQLTFGRQNLWLGPGEVGPFLFSTNAEPMTMLRIEPIAPYQIPVLSRWLGPVRSQFFLGRLSGQSWEYSPQLFGPRLSSQPFLHGTKVNFHPTPNLEFGFGFTAQFGGSGNPFTWRNFLRTFYSHQVGVGRNPAKRLSEFDFNYRVPGLRNWVQAYCDLMVIDEYSPIGSTRPAINPGLYFSHLPWLRKMDLRMEGVTTDLDVPGHYGAGAFYWDGRYRSGYTNAGNLIGSWVGRRGRAEQAWLTYHFGTQNMLQVGYRHNNVDKAFLDGGELRDISLRGQWKLTNHIGIGGWVQQEKWHFPLLASTGKSNVLVSVEMMIWPHGRSER